MTIRSSSSTRRGHAERVRLRAADEAGSERSCCRNAFFMSRRTRVTTRSTPRGREKRERAAKQARRSRRHPTPGPTTFPALGGTRAEPDRQITRNPAGKHRRRDGGRIGALAIRRTARASSRRPGRHLDLGPATTTGSEDRQPCRRSRWARSPSRRRTTSSSTRGTGEGHLSGDSYFGNGVLKSTDGGTRGRTSRATTSAVSRSRASSSTDATRTTSTPRPPRPRRLAARDAAEHSSRNLGVDRRRRHLEAPQGDHRGRPARPTSRSIREPVDPLRLVLGRRDLQGHQRAARLDADHDRHPRETGGPRGEPDAVLDGALAPGRPEPGPVRGLRLAGRTGYHPSRVFKSTDAGRAGRCSKQSCRTVRVEDYCGGQCFYDNVIEAAPDNPDVVYAGGRFDYSMGSGGSSAPTTAARPGGTSG